MGKAKEKKTIVRDNWISSFSIIGEARVNDYTFKLDGQSERSSWVYNSLNLGIDCGEKYGVVYTELFGGYDESGKNVIRVHGKKDDGSDDFDTRIDVDWEDRFDDAILKTIGDLSFLTVGLEKTDKGKTFYKKFLSAYDAVAYISEYLKDGMVVNVRGTIRYSMYQDKTQVHKNITSMVLSSVDDPAKYAARFTQSVLLDQDSASLKPDNIDTDKGVMYVNGRVLDYVGEMNGHEVKGQFPFRKQFEFRMDFTNQDNCRKIMDRIFKIRKGITQIAFDGEFIEGGATITATVDDIPEDIRELIDLGLYSEEEALQKLSANGSREQRMVFTRPYFKLVGENKTPVIQRFDEKYTEDDLYLDYVFAETAAAEKAGENVDTSNTESQKVSDDDMAWLDAL